MSKKSSSGISKRKQRNTQSNVAGTAATSQQAAQGDMIRGVSQVQIDQLRGTRDHQSAGSIDWITIQQDYKRVGITITDDEARDIHTSIKHFSFGYDTAMRKARALQQLGREHDLTSEQKEYLRQYALCEEYCRVAPIYPSTKQSMIYRGIKFSTITPDYSAGIVALKVGDKWNADGMPSSYSTRLTVAKDFSYHAGQKGIIMHMPTKGLKNSPSIKGISSFPSEDEVFVADYNWKVAKISDQRQQGDGYYHIYLEHA